MKKYNSLLSFNLQCAAGPAREGYARRQPGDSIKQDATMIMSHIECFNIHDAKTSGNQTKENNHKGAGIESHIRQERH